MTDVDINVSDGKELKLKVIVVPAGTDVADLVKEEVPQVHFDYFVLIGFDDKKAERPTLVFGAEVEQIYVAQEMIADLVKQLEGKVHPDVISKAIVNLILRGKDNPEDNAPGRK